MHKILNTYLHSSTAAAAAAAVCLIMRSYNIFGPQETFGLTDSITAIGDCIRELDSRKASSGNANMKLVVSMSFGGNSSISIMADALAAITAERSDVLLVASAGNTGDGTVSYPAGYPEVVSGA
jgi:hypothetical protein